MWSRIRCAHCSKSFTSVSTLLAHTHTADDRAAAERGAGAVLTPPRAPQQTTPVDSSTAMTGAPGRRDVHRIRVRSSSRREEVSHHSGKASDDHPNLRTRAAARVPTSRCHGEDTAPAPMTGTGQRPSSRRWSPWARPNQATMYRR